MSAPRFARLASQLLAKAQGSTPPPPNPAARAKAIAALERVIATRARRKRLLRAGWAVVASAAVAATVFGLAQWLASRSAPLVLLRPSALDAKGGQSGPSSSQPAHAPTVIVAHPGAGGANLVLSGAQAPLFDGRALPVGSRVVTPPAGRATLEFSTGTGVSLGEGTDMTVAGEGTEQVLRLDAGSIELQVAKVGAGRRFVVETNDTEIEVRGTKFRVSIAPADALCGAATRTRVAVSEGVVAVRYAGVETRVPAGGQWPGGCGNAARPAASPAGNGRGGIGPSVATIGAHGSTLGEQNDSFAGALAAKQAGDAQGALVAFDRFIAKFPSSPLAESAYVERMRLLRTIAPARAVTSAKEYLAVHPNGFAHAEAEAIVAGTP